MWVYGYTDPFWCNGPIDVFYGSCDGFMEAVELLYDHVEKESVEADSYQMSHFDQVLGAIRAVRDNPDIRFNEDNWIETTFTDKLGEVEYLVTFVA
jgi:hypothetical protein